MAHENDGGAVVEQVIDRRQGSLNAGIIGDNAIAQWHVEVDAHQRLVASANRCL